jgi:hypothetical protein
MGLERPCLGFADGAEGKEQEVEESERSRDVFGKTECVAVIGQWSMKVANL